MKVLSNRIALFIAGFLLLFICKSALAQTNERQIDSLNILINNLEGLSRIVEMNRFAQENVNSNPYISIYFAKQSIELAIKNDSIKQKVDALIILGDAFFTISEYDSAKYYYYKSLAQISVSTDSVTKAKLYAKVGNVSLVFSNYNNSIEYYNLAIDIYRKHGVYFELAKEETHLGNAYQKINKYTKALKHFQIAIDIGDSINDEYISSYAHSQAAIVYDILGDYRNAIRYNLEAMPVFDSLKQSTLLYNTKCNLALVYSKNSEFKKAKTLLRGCIVSSKKMNNMRSQAASLSIMGGVLYLEKKYDSALTYYSESLNINRKLGVSNNMYYNLVNMASICVDAGYYIKANKYISDALDYSLEINNFTLIAACYGNLSLISKSQNRYKDALSYYELFHNYRDSLSLFESRKHLNELETKYQTKLKDKENAMLSQSLLFEKKENEKNKEYSKLMTILFFCIVLLLILVIAFLYIYRKSSERKLLVAKLEKEKAIEKLKRINSEIIAKALIVSKVVKGFNKLSGEIKKLKKSSNDDNRTLFKKIDYLLGRTSKELKDFSEVEKELNLANIDFHKKLLRINPEFSPTELKLCTLLQMNMSTKEICDIIYRSPRTVEGFRYSIRKKLNIDSKENLNTYLMKLSE